MVQTIGTIIATRQKPKDLKELPRLCASSTRMVSSIIGKFPTIEDFCKACSPSAQQRYVSEPLSAFYRQTATLTDLNNAYRSRDAAATWLVPQLCNVSEFCGCKYKITDDQLADIATLLASSYPYVKVSEFLLFFAWFKAGKYGKFYGNVDPMVITTAFREFMQDRGRKYAEIENILAERKREEEKKKPHYTREEWERIKQQQKLEE